MNKLMKLIPQEYSQQVLDLIGMPTNRFIFMDNWYVPYERHCSHKEVYKILQSLGVEFIEKMKNMLQTFFIWVSMAQGGLFNSYGDWSENSKCDEGNALLIDSYAPRVGNSINLIQNDHRNLRS